MLLTFLHTAGRKAEIFNLKWDDIDFSRSFITLWTAKRSGAKEPDTFPLTRELKAELLKWREIRPVKSEYVFVVIGEDNFTKDFYGKPFKARQRFMKKMCKRAGVKHFGFHAIRHLTATELYHKGEPEAVIQAMMRHKNATTTARYLKSLGAENIRGPLEKVFK